MNNAPEHLIDLGETDDGNWAAVARGSPYFYFEGIDKASVLKRASAALDYYHGIKGAIEPLPPKRPVSFSRIKNSRPVSRTELEAA